MDIILVLSVYVDNRVRKAGERIFVAKQEAERLIKAKLAVAFKPVEVIVPLKEILDEPIVDDEETPHVDIESFKVKSENKYKK